MSDKKIKAAVIDYLCSCEPSQVRRAISVVKARRDEKRMTLEEYRTMLLKLAVAVGKMIDKHGNMEIVDQHGEQPSIQIVRDKETGRCLVF